MEAAPGLRIGVVATRLGGIDGVSLEAEAWARELRAPGHEVFAFAGRVEAAVERCRVVPLAFFGHPRVAAIDKVAFELAQPAAAVASMREAIGRLVDELRQELDEYVRTSELDLLIAENTLSLPFHLPLGLALTELAAESGLPVIARHHDLPWERQRYSLTNAADLVERAFPPQLPNVHHVCINSLQRREIARRLGREARIIPNTVELDDVPEDAAAHAIELRAELRVSDDELFVLQPTRVVPRKGIEHALELVRRLERPARLVVVGGWSDEGEAYGQHIAELARLLGVEVVWASERVAQARSVGPDGTRVYALDDAFAAADLVTYPSLVEGFGRAFLAAVRQRRPLVVNRYPVYDLDIRPHGFKVVELDGFVSEDAVQQTRTLLADPAMRADWAEHNLAIVRRSFSSTLLRRELRAELADIVA